MAIQSDTTFSLDVEGPHSFYSGANTYNTPGSLGGRKVVTAGILVEVEPYQELLSRQWFLTRYEHQNCLSSFLNMHMPKPHPQILIQ